MDHTASWSFSDILGVIQQIELLRVSTLHLLLPSEVVACFFKFSHVLFL